MTLDLVHSGKVCDVYTDGTDVILIASDRVSVYDVALPTRIPDKGRILTQLSLWWFDQLADVVPNHVISATQVPDDWRGRAIRCRSLDMIKVVCIAFGYLTGSAWAGYQQTGQVAGAKVPTGLVEASRLDEPIFTAMRKAPSGDRDTLITFDDLVAEVGHETATQLRRLTLEIYRRGAALAARRGLIIADTKLEFGRAPDGSLVLADELLTPDSSRYWLADEWQPGRPQHAFDKQLVEQFVRDWAAAKGWDRTPPGPHIPDDVVKATRARYVELYERITGQKWES